MKVSQGRSDLLAHLREQLRFLDASASSYDAGFEGEAKRLAVVMRVLLHDTANSRSLLQSLGIKNTLRYNDVVGPVPTNAIIFVGLQMGFTETGMRYYPKLQTPVRTVEFEEWWNGLVLVQKPAGIALTRSQAVLPLANTDGGAHVDPRLDADYAALSRKNAFAWEVWKGDRKGVVDNSPALPITRQVAHEVAGTIREQLADALGAQGD
jgi:hypothetical protein